MVGVGRVAHQKGFDLLIEVAKMAKNQKKDYIMENGIPFSTLVYLKGHIMLYVGIKNNEPLVMHNMWGVRTWEFPFSEGRNVVGKTVITSLEPGRELINFNKQKSILKKVQGIVILNEGI